MKIQIALLLTILSITACDSANKTPSNNTIDTTPDLTKILGVLVDPYITQARLCLDLDGNDSCDSNEQVTESDDNGRFSFNREDAIGQDTKIITLNRGSFQFPDYGYHNGIPYKVAMQSSVTDAAEIIITPASTVLETINIDAASLALILNQFSGTIGKTFTADDMSGDPFANMDLAAAIDADILARLKANLVVYAMLRTINGFRGLDGYQSFISSFAAQAQQSSSPVYALLNSMVNGISAGLNLDLLNSFKTAISTANDSIALQSGGLATPIPDLSGAVILEVATAITDYLVDTSLVVVSEQLSQDSTDTFDVRFANITTLANAQLVQAQSQLATLIGKLGPMAYGAVNKEQIDSYTGLFASVRAGIFSVPFIEAGYNCAEGHFAVVYQYNDPANPSSLTADAGCTSSLPKQVGKQVASASSNPEAIEANMWANLPIGKLQVSDQAGGCIFQGTVKDSNNAVMPFVPIYFAFPATGQEMHLQTDIKGQFSFTHIPIATEADYPDPQYFFGTYAGSRAPHPAFKNKESVSDFNIRCETPITFTFNPIMKDLVDNTVITGSLSSNIVTDGFRVEIRADIPSDTLSPLSITSAFIRESIADETDYNFPDMDFNKINNNFEIRSLAGGNYSFGIVVPATATQDFIEFLTVSVAVPAGQTTNIDISLNIENNQYSLSVDGGAEQTYSYTPLISP